MSNKTINLNWMIHPKGIKGDVLRCFAWLGLFCLGEDDKQHFIVILNGEQDRQIDQNSLLIHQHAIGSH